MVTLEIHGQYVTWPEDFALTMMRYYRNHGVPFTVHRNHVHPGGNTGENAPPVKVKGVREEYSYSRP